VWVWGFGGWGSGAGPQPPKPQSPIPNPQSPISYLIIKKYFIKIFNIYILEINIKIKIYIFYIL